MRHNEKPEGPSVRVLRVGEQVRHVLYHFQPKQMLPFFISSLNKLYGF